MNIQILQLIEGAREATGLTVIIDVLRAFSTACYAFDKGAVRIIPVENIEEAYQIKNQNPEYLLMGERNEMKPHGFDFGNSPSHLTEADLRGKTIVHTTSSGTRGIVSAVNSEQVITGSFVNAGAIIKHIRLSNPGTVSLVCMGYACEYATDEDTLCAEFIKNELEGVTNDFEKYVEIIKKGSGKRFFNPDSQAWAPSSDLDLCLELNRFDFILKVIYDNNSRFLQPLPV